jgi:hypothetical protein
MPDTVPDTVPDTDARHALVFAIAHEVGNHLAGIRLEAHLLDEDLGSLGLARASLALDSLAGQAGPLLALLRPLLAPRAQRAAGPRYAALLDGVRRQLEDEGAGGRPVELEVAKGAEAAGPAFEGLHALVLALIGSPDTLPSGKAPIRLRVGRRESEVEIVCELPGDAFEGAVLHGGAEGGAPALRGRPLAVAIARALVADVGGRVAVEAGAGCSRVVLRLPRD